MAQDWQPFDYKNPPEEGVYWLEVERPDTWCDVDDYGKSIGGYTGKSHRLVVLSLVYEQQNELGEWETMFEPVRGCSCGEVEDGDGVVRFMPLEAPALPQAADLILAAPRPQVST